MKTSMLLLSVVLLPSAASATYSIAALDPATGEIGVAVQSRAFNVGMAVPWVEAGVGAIATQAFTNESFGPRGLALLRTGLSADETLQWLLDHDAGRENRQVGIVDAKGGTAQHTGSQANDWKGGIVGEDFVCQGNILAGEEVVKAMAKAFRETEGDLGARLLAALLAGEAAGGDRRGKQSAAILVGRPSDTNPQFRTRYVDIRVDDSEEPLVEIERLYHMLEATDLAPAHLLYAEQYRDAGDDAAVDREMRRLSLILKGALGREDTTPETLNSLAWSLAVNDTDLPGALEAAERAVAASPSSYEIMDTLAETCFRLGRYDDAIAAGEKALALSPDDAYLKAQLERFRERRTDREPGETGE